MATMPPGKTPVVAGTTLPSSDKLMVLLSMVVSPWFRSIWIVGVGWIAVALMSGDRSAINDDTGGMVIGMPAAEGTPRACIWPAFNCVSRSWTLFTYPTALVMALLRIGVLALLNNA